MDVVFKIRAEEDSRGVDRLIDKLNELQEQSKASEEGTQSVLERIAKTNQLASDALQGLGKEMAESRGKMKSLEREQSRLEKGARALGDRYRIFGRSLTQINDSIQRAASGLFNFGKRSKESGEQAAKGFGAARVAGLALRGALGVVGIAVAAIGSTFLRSEKNADKFNVTVAGVRAGAGLLIDRASKAAGALSNIFTDGLFTSIRNAASAFSGLGDEIQREVIIAQSLEAQFIRLDRADLLLDARRAATNRRLKELKLISDDVTAGTRAQIAANQEALRLETELNQVEQERARNRIELLLRDFSGVNGVIRSIESLRQRGLNAQADVLEAELAAGQARTSEVIAALVEGAESYEQIISNLDFGGEAPGEEELAELTERFKIFNEVQERSLDIQNESGNSLRNIQNTALEAARSAQEQANQALLDLQEVQRDVRDALRESEGLEGEAQIEQNRTIALEQIADLERVARERFEAANQAFNLEAEFAELRRRANEAADREITDFRIEQQKKALEESRDNELALIAVARGSEEEKAEQRLEVQREYLRDLRAVVEREGGNVLEVDVELAELDAQDIERIQNQAIAALDQQQAIENARIDLIQETNSTVLTLEQEKELRRLELTRDGVLARIEILREAGASEAELTLLDLQAQRLEQQIAEIGNVNIDPIRALGRKIAEALKISEEDLQLIIGQVGGIINNLVAGVDNLREAELSRIDGQIEAARERADELRSLLEQEQEDQERGFANNVDLYESALAEQERIEAEASERRLEIQRREANQQLAIETAQQAASAATATAKLLSAEAGKGLLGVILAATTGLALIFTTIARARANAAAFQNPQFREGGRIENGVLVGPSHENGGIPIVFGKGRNRQMIEAEGGEHIFSKKKTKQYSTLFDAIQNNRIDRMTPAEIFGSLGHIPNPVMGTPVIKVEPGNSSPVNPTSSGDVHFVPVEGKKDWFWRIDESGPVRRFDKIHAK